MIDFASLFKTDPTSPSYLRWKVSRGQRVRAGDVAGNLETKGYYVVGAFGKLYKVHRIVALLEGLLTDIHDPMQIDHIDGVITNNKPTNLRPVTVRQNQQNQKRHRGGRLLGCCLLTNGKWRASIKRNGATVNLGHFHTEADANAAYLKALESI